MKAIAWVFALVASVLVQALDSKHKIRYIASAIPAKTAKGLLLRHADTPETGHFEVFNINRERVNQKYLCYVPPASENSTGIVTGKDTKQISDINEDDLLDMALEILSETFNTTECVFNYKSIGYWTIGYCLGDKVIQFHENLSYYRSTGEHKPEDPNFVFTLGRFPESPTTSTSKVEILNKLKGREYVLDRNDFTVKVDPSILFPKSGESTSQSHKVLSHTLKQGLTCELTNEPRTIEVLYKCDPKSSASIIDFMEYKTCQYQMTIATESLCSLDAFRPTSVQDVVIPIDCRSIAGDIVQESAVNDVSLLDFYSYLISQDTPRIKTNKKISLGDYNLSPIGGGMFTGQIKEYEPWETPKEILVSIKDLGSDREILELADIIYSSLLDFNEKSSEAVLKWADQFIVWIELYDFYGNLKTVLRILRQGGVEDKVLSIQLVDPDTLLDQAGDRVEALVPILNENLGNFEVLNKAGILQAGKKIESVIDEQRNGDKEGSTQGILSKTLIKQIMKSLNEKSPEDLLQLLSVLNEIDSEMAEYKDVKDSKEEETAANEETNNLKQELSEHQQKQDSHQKQESQQKQEPQQKQETQNQQETQQQQKQQPLVQQPIEHDEL